MLVVLFFELKVPTALSSTADEYSEQVLLPLDRRDFSGIEAMNLAGSPVLFHGPQEQTNPAIARVTLTVVS